MSVKLPVLRQKRQEPHTKKTIRETKQDDIDGDNDILDVNARKELSNSTEDHEDAHGEVDNATAIGISIAVACAGAVSRYSQAVREVHSG